jgi:hypothetical protein
MNIAREDITRGYEPVAKLDTNIMTSRKALSTMGFPNSEIDKMNVVAKERKRFGKRSKELAKLSKKGKLESEKDILGIPKTPICDICGNSTGLGIAKLTSVGQEAKLPDGWALVRFGSPDDSDYRAYAIVPLGIVIDYQGGRVYVICGNCQLKLGLVPTESGILIHSITEGTGYGFVDLDKVEKLIQECKT